jgi:CelD/BcsL family acetyltransferase involved in cellulose biosynthesis
MERSLTATEAATTRVVNASPICSSGPTKNVMKESAHPATAVEISVQFYEDSVPNFAAAELERLYESIYSSLARFQIYAEDRNISTYVARRGAEVVAVFLFRMEGDQVTVLNQQTSIRSDEISRFADAVFSRFKRTKVVSLWGVMPTEGRLPLLSQTNFCLSDVVVALPTSAEAYLSSLGKSTRRHVRSNLKRLAQTFPSFRAQAFVRGEICAQHIRDIIQLSNARMVIKENVTYNSDEETPRLIQLANVYGMVLTLTIDDRVSAGAVCYRVGSTYFAQVLAHDPKFDDYKLGLVCCYLMICECIERGGSVVRFGGSTHRYKFDFQGVLIRQNYVVIYRSLAQLLMHSVSALEMSARAYLSRLKLWLLLADRRDDRVSRIATRIIIWVRQFKRSGYLP